MHLFSPYSIPMWIVVAACAVRGALCYLYEFTSWVIAKTASPN
jgi:hypothetical protein